MLNDTAHDAMLDHLGALVDEMSLHTADPGTDGANEVSGGTYGRQRVSWSNATGRRLKSARPPTFDVPGATTVNHVGFWSASGTFYGSVAITPETFNNPGTYTLSATEITLP